MNEGLVSVVVPVFNRPRLLAESVGSVLAQTYERFEIIIVDDSSTDDTPRVIEELRARDSRIHSVRRANGGPGLARETARRLAQGPTLALGMTKRMVNNEWNMDLLSALEAEAQAQALLMMGQDHRIFYEAFLEKAKPAFVGR